VLGAIILSPAGGRAGPSGVARGGWCRPLRTVAVSPRLLKTSPFLPPRFRLRSLTGRLDDPGEVRLGRRHRVLVEMERLVEVVHLARREVAPLPDLQMLKCQRPDAHPPQARHRDANEVHHAANDMEHPLVEDDLQNEPVMRLAEDSAFLGYDPFALDHETVPYALQLGLTRPGERQDVILLGKPISGVHDAVRDITIVCQKEQSLGCAIEPSHGIDSFWNLHEIHDGPPVPLVADGGDIAARLIQQQVARGLRA